MGGMSRRPTSTRLSMRSHIFIRRRISPIVASEEQIAVKNAAHAASASLCSASIVSDFLAMALEEKGARNEGQPNRDEVEPFRRYAQRGYDEADKGCDQ